MKYVILPAVIFALATTAIAKEVPIKVECKASYINESYITITINEKAENYSSAQQKFNAKIKQVEDIAKESGLKKLELQNSNISVSPSSDGYDNKAYYVNGSLSYKSSEDEGALFAFMDNLQKKDLKAGYSNSKRRSDSCPTN